MAGRPTPGRAGFDERISLHEQEMRACEAFLRRYSFTVDRVGQEATPGDWQRVARTLHDDETARAERYRPDLIAAREDCELLLKVAVKSRHPGSPNTAIEEACHKNALAERSLGRRVAYWFPGQRMTWPEDLIPMRAPSSRLENWRAKGRGGSGTPFILIANESISTSADTFIMELIWPRLKT